MSTQAGTWAAASQTASGGTASWSNLNNTQLLDGNVAYAGVLAHTGVSYALAVSFSFTGANAIPLGATINGFTFAIVKSANNASAVYDDGIYCGIPGVDPGTDQSGASAWPTSLTNTPYGGSNSLCGVNPLNATPANINTNGMAVSIQCNNTYVFASTASVDYVALTVYYTLGTNQVIPKPIVISVPAAYYPQNQP